MAGNVQAIPRIPQRGAQSNFYTEIYQYAEAITRIAVKILFITGSILMTGAVLPITWHAIAIPVVAMGTTVLAGFFYPLPNPIRGPLFPQLPPLVRPVQVGNGALPAHFPADSPRGLHNAGQNCAFNSMAHFLESDPEIADWIRHPLMDNIDLPGFQNFLAQYNPQPHLVHEFNEFVGRAPVPRPPIPTLFTQFLEAYIPPAADRASYDAIRGTYRDLRLLQGSFSAFFRANDTAVEGRQAISRANSQNLRLALNRVTPAVDPSPHIQMDVREAVGPLLDVLPDHLKAKIETTYHYNEDVTRLHPMREEPRAVVEERTGYFSLPINGQGPIPLQTLFESYCNDNEGRPTGQNTPKFHDINGVRREYPVDRVTVSLLEAPPALHFHIKRFSHEKPPVSWWSQWFPRIFPPLEWRAIKLETLINCPEELTVTLKNGEVSRYRLTSFVNHYGANCNSGHYTAGRVINGHKFSMSDTEVTLDPANWDEQLQHAYLLCYVRVPNPALAVQ